jgi:putative CocE/NonD family hydrolase
VTAHRRAATLVASVLLGTGVGARGLAQDTAAHAGGAGVVVTRDVMVPMRDGIHLATDVYRPRLDRRAVTEQLPTILIRSPYGKDFDPLALAPSWAAHGYAVVVQDTRGRYKSEGVWHWLTDDGPDGVDTVDWISRQPWSNGAVGMWGISYLGGTAHALAMAGDAHLKTVIPIDAVSDMGYHGLRNGGAFELRFFNWIFSYGLEGSHEARDSTNRRAFGNLSHQRRDFLRRLPLRRGTTPLQLAPEYEDWLVQAMAHGANDDFWAQNDIIDHPERYKDIPVYLIGGWYDSWAASTAANFVALSGRLKSPVYLIMGPWIHGSQGQYAHGQVSFGPDAAMSQPNLWWQEWFDHFLKGKDNSVGKAAPFSSRVRIFVMGTGDHMKDAQGRMAHGGRWRDEREWPLARTRYTSYYLQPGGGLALQLPAAERSETSFVFDPHDPVPTIGGNISSGDGILLQGAWDQRGGDTVWNWPRPVPLSARRDVLVFQTAPLETDVEVTGPITVKLWASSNRRDTDFTAKLIDVHPPSADYPQGFDLNLEDGIMRARFRNSLTRERLMEPGTVYEFTIKLYPTSNVFRKGHRIRVDISSSNFPRFDVNPNTGEPLNDNHGVLVATNTIYHDRAHPSHIVLPIIPAPDR